MNKLILKATNIFIILLVISCSKEKTDNSQLSQGDLVTFDVKHESTKTSMGPSNTVIWSDEDQVNVFNETSLLGKPNIVEGKISFRAPLGKNSFYCIYPYNKKAYISKGIITTWLPDVQEAITGSFGSNTNLSIAHSSADNKTFIFKNIGAIAKFNIDKEEDDITSIEISGKNAESIAGKVQLDYNNGEPIASSTAISSKSITLSKNDGTALTAGATYYFILLPRTMAGGITLKFTRKSGGTFIKEISSRLTFKRGTITDLGVIKDPAKANDLYNLYESGVSISIAGVTYNKSSNGPATLLSATTANTDLKSSIEKGGVFFLEQNNESAYFGTSGLCKISKEVVLISRHINKKVKFAPSSCMFYMKGSFILKNLIIDLSNLNSSRWDKKYLLNNADASADFEKLHFEDCDILNSGTSIIYAGSKPNYGLRSLKMIRNKMHITENTAKYHSLFNFYNSVAADSYKEFIFEDNIIYRSTVAPVRIVYFNVKTQPGKSWETTLSVNHNIFYNVIGSEEVQFKIYQASKISFENNIYYAGTVFEPDFAFSKTPYCFFTILKDQPKDALTSLEGNISSGLSEQWSLAHLQSSIIPKINTIVKVAENPFDKEDIKNGIFVVKKNFSKVGPRPKYEN